MNMKRATHDLKTGTGPERTPPKPAAVGAPAAADSVVPLKFLKKADPVLAAIIERVGPYKIEYREPVFQTLVRSIVYQQLNGKAALTIFNRLAEAAKADPLTPESILRLRPARMRTLGLSKQKLTYIRELARLTRSGELKFELFHALEDAHVIEHLTRVKGVGVWTAHMFLIFALRRPDVLPTGDFGVRAAMKKAYNLSEMPKPAEMERIAAAWRPYSSVASWYLWRSLENQGAL
jgi:DNA-3-methyladenine glycosylase II